jgi:hypothetical protein
MTTESEYETEALSMLAQYGQTLNMSGNGLAKCPYEFEKEYFVGDKIKVAFSGKSATAQILSVTERWAWGNYSIQFSFGKPQNNLADQLQLMLRKIQASSNKVNSIESVKWYDVTTVSTMPDSDVTYNTIGFTGTLSADKTFTLYLDDEGAGSKSYNIYTKNLSGNFNLTLTTGVSGKSNFMIKGGQNIVARILVDEEGNIISQGMTATNVIEAGNLQPITSDTLATSDAMPVDSVTVGNTHSVTSNAVADTISYSETEHQVGYWIDGSPLYERTVRLSVPNNGSYSISIPTNHKVKVWRGNFFQGRVENPEWIMHIPYTYLNGMPLSEWINIYVFAQGGSFFCDFFAGGRYASSYFNGVAIITYKYTKT